MCSRARGQLDAEAAVVSVTPRRLLQASFFFGAQTRGYGVDALLGHPSREILAVVLDGARAVLVVKSWNQHREQLARSS